MFGVFTRRPSHDPTRCTNKVKSLPTAYTLREQQEWQPPRTGIPPRHIVSA
ncbi:hypothetical protein NEUTE1DRAFT_100984 [Neurospora tetrasperma FGSC 2508]|uniref:Uncharacterized protein n=1 Tax=Neurospora tetrasperma (strain FGSC 2508 / ATCC MYA-4615 / P0657) TaxID=510951 RepID=F8MJS4_NEUT8|nr:uncharacterized protein NEUTE1DRAFT_100984 [Neurospora tetrasperma FGSC 2508]EGO58111.1 hypothetical protein NEUTE1DRAFT_100984 [Neurospora tetrasperma FGSC 2508]EGZ71580.1 hypothetical protein NEUTE2DRAFT_128969 [Neurospora tetrasperma FGSC 2509]